MIPQSAGFTAPTTDDKNIITKIMDAINAKTQQGIDNYKKDYNNTQATIKTAETVVDAASGKWLVWAVGILIVILLIRR